MSVRARPTAGRASSRGISLLELALGLAVLGILLGIAWRSSHAMEAAKTQQTLAQVRQLVGDLDAFRTGAGRWPGDCNRDGLIDFMVEQTSPGVAQQAAGSDPFDYVASTGLAAAPSASAAYAAGATCPTVTVAPFPPVNVPYNELKAGGQLPLAQANRLAARHAMGGAMFIGSFAAPGGERHNVLVLSQLPARAAQALAVALDGFDGGRADVGRVRRLRADLQGFAPAWQGPGEGPDTRLLVAVLFDVVPAPAAN